MISKGMLMNQYIGFRLHEALYAVPILSVREIIDLPDITPLPLAPEYYAGVTDLRGNVIPVLDIRHLINISKNGDKPGKVIVISRGRMVFGILVDAISGVRNIDESDVEPAVSISDTCAEKFQGIAKKDGEMIILLKPESLVPVDDPSLLEDRGIEVREGQGGAVEITRTLQTMAGEVRITELKSAREFLEQRKASMPDDPRNEILDDIVSFMEAVTEHNYAMADEAVARIVKKSDSGLFREIGKITRRLHDTLKGFRDSIEPRLGRIVASEMPGTADRLQYVIDRTEEAAHKTMSVVEKYILKMDDLSSHIRRIESPKESQDYLRQFKNSLEDDLTEIITTQSFQDITGQTIKKVIGLVNSIEEELVRLIATFGLKIEQNGHDKKSADTVSQADVDELLKEFGF